MKIKKRLLVSYAILIGMLMVAGVVAVIMISRIGDNLTRFYNYQNQTIVNSWTARNATDASVSSALQSMLDTDPVVTKESIEKAKQEAAIQEQKRKRKSVSRRNLPAKATLLQERTYLRQSSVQPLHTLRKRWLPSWLVI